MSDDTPVKKKRGNPNFYKGMKALNPEGRPKGSLNKYTKLSRELMSTKGPEIVNKVIEMALEGDIISKKKRHLTVPFFLVGNINLVQISGFELSRERSCRRITTMRSVPGRWKGRSNLRQIASAVMLGHYRGLREWARSLADYCATTEI